MSSWRGMKIRLHANGDRRQSERCKLLLFCIKLYWLTDWTARMMVGCQSVLRALLGFLFIRCFPVLPFFPFRLRLCVYNSSVSFPVSLFSPSVWFTVVCAAVLLRRFVFVCLFPAVFAFTALPLRLPFGAVCHAAVWLRVWPFSPLLLFLFLLLSLRGFLGLLLFLGRCFSLAVSSVFGVICLSAFRKKYSLRNVEIVANFKLLGINNSDIRLQSINKYERKYWQRWKGFTLIINRSDMPYDLYGISALFIIKIKHFNWLSDMNTNVDLKTVF